MGKIKLTGSAREQFQKVYTGNGIDRDLAATTNDRLELSVMELQNLQKNNTLQTNKLSKLLDNLDFNLMSLQLRIDSLVLSIKDANDKNDKLQRRFLFISIVGTIFAASGILQVIDIIVRGIGK